MRMRLLRVEAQIQNKDRDSPVCSAGYVHVCGRMSLCCRCLGLQEEEGGSSQEEGAEEDPGQRQAEAQLQPVWWWQLILQGCQCC